MILLITQYLLVGLIISFLLEHIIRWTEQDVSFLERVWMITLWPIMVLVFLFNFIKGIFGQN